MTEEQKVEKTKGSKERERKGTERERKTQNKAKDRQRDRQTEIYFFFKAYVRRNSSKVCSKVSKSANSPVLLFCQRLK